MIRCTVAHVDLEALQANYRAITDYLRQGTPGPDRRPPEGTTALERPGVTTVKPPGVMAVVKANAYGHGAGPVGCALQEAGATMLACADIEEGIELRQAGVRVEILIFGALSVSDLDGVFEYQLTPTVSTPSAGRALQKTAAARGVRIPYHLKIDTGMNRLGFRHDNLARTLPELFAYRELELAGVYTHFGTANETGHPLFHEQQARFRHVLSPLLAEGFQVTRPVRHAANSAAILRDPDVWFDLVRPGLLLYGVVPPPLPETVPLQPVMSLTSRVVAVKGVRPGDSVGYGADWTARRPSRVATVPAGYADGLDMRLAGRGHVLVRGRRAPIIGSVCMDMITIDITGVEADTGDEVVILGTQGEDTLGVREMATAISGSPYEILCRIGTRIERVYEGARA